MSIRTTVTTDQPKTIIVESRLIYTLWTHGRAYAGFEAEFEVKTLLVGDGGKVKVTCRTESGKKLGKVEGGIFMNRFRGKVLIPETVKPGDYIYLETELPKHGLRGESNSIPVRPPLEVSSIKWSKKEISREEEVDLSCVFTNGVEEGDNVEVIVYEYKGSGNHDSVVSIPATVKNNRVDLKWKFMFHYDVTLIPTEAELNKYGKHYTQPQYFFVVMVDNIAVGKNQESGLLLFQDRVEITVHHGIFLSNENTTYTITFADGSSVKKTADSNKRIIIDKAPPGVFTILPENSPTSDTVTGKTGTRLVAVFPAPYLFADAHMHIQSNNCCPLPLQWGLIAERVGFLIGRPECDRKSLNMLAAGVIGQVFTRRLGKIGRLSTDMISKLYGEKLYDNDMRHELCWTVLSDAEMEKYKDNPEEMRIIAGRKAQLSALTKRSCEQYDEQFVTNTRYYFEGNLIRRMGIALLMDLSFSCYWSRFGLPLYLSTSNGMYYINDFAAIELRQERLSDTVKVFFSDSVLTPEIDLSPDIGKHEPQSDLRCRLHLFPSFSAKECEPLGPSSLYQDQFDKFGMSGGSVGNTLPLIRFERTEKVRTKLLCKYVHFVSKAPGENAKRFEEYSVQRERSIAGAIMHPLSLFLFYHYDPRRHCLSDTRSTESIAEEIVKNHAFFTAVEDGRYVGIAENVRTFGCVDAKEHSELNDVAKLSVLLGEQLLRNADAFSELHLYKPSGRGVFWGVKMYPRLGFSPSDFARYPQLEEFYRECAEKRIPITAHCSPGGMSIADYFLYERYDERRFLDRSEKTNYDLKASADRFDGVVAGAVAQDSPARWEEVLKKHPSLKLNLAHFGGAETWKECAGFGNMEKEVENCSGGGMRGSSYDKCDLYRDWTKKIAELIEKYDNVYTDISFFVNDDPSWVFGLGHDRDDVGGDLIELLEKYPTLKDRLLMGSDWYMIEKEGEEGIGDYLRKMFYMLRTVSEKTGYDAWHQFSVVNPLRFLGLIDDKKGSTGPFTIDVEKVKGLKEKFERKMDEDEWCEDAGCTIRADEFNKQFDEMFSILKTITIKSSDKILRDNQLAILPPEKK